MNIEAIGKALITILGAILTYIVGPYILSKTTKEQREDYYFWTKLAVQAAEQIYREKGQGKLKKEYVVDFLVSKGINLTVQELDVLIEAAVKELNMAQEALKE